AERCTPVTPPSSRAEPPEHQRNIAAARGGAMRWPARVQRRDSTRCRSLPRLALRLLVPSAVMDLSSALPTTHSPSPTLVRGFLLRFGFVYAALFLIPVVAGSAYGFEWSGDLVQAACKAIVGWVARSVFGLWHGLVWGGGSGDKTVDWIWLLCCATIALVASMVWLAIDRRRAHEAQIRAVLRVMIRYCIAYTLLSYGISKLFIR